MSDSTEKEKSVFAEFYLPGLPGSFWNLLTFLVICEHQHEDFFE